MRLGGNDSKHPPGWASPSFCLPLKKEGNVFACFEVRLSDKYTHTHTHNKTNAIDRRTCQPKVMLDNNLKATKYREACGDTPMKCQ